MVFAIVYNPEKHVLTHFVVDMENGEHVVEERICSTRINFI